MKDKQWLKARMEKLWHPRRVAMIGATNSLMKWGFLILARMLGEGFAGEVYPINPRESSVLGRRAYPDILAVPDPIDLAIIVTPGPTVPAVLRECGAKKVPAAIVITSGFSEVGPEGRALEAEIVALARSADIMMVGPNTMGIFSAEDRLNCLMAPISPLPGRAGCIAQSGNVGTHMLFSGKMRGLGFGKFVSSGNEGDLTFEDYLWYFGQDPAINAVLAYVEGLEPGSDFMAVAAEVTKHKPLILYKGGRTGAGARAAASHTGALAGDSLLFTRAMKQAGVILADSNKEVVELARAMEFQPVPRGNRIGILTRGGGWGVITADACVEAGLNIAELSPQTIDRIGRLLPPYWSHGNPVDMVAVISNQAYIDCLQIMIADPNVDAIIALGANSGAHVATTVQSLRRLQAMPEANIAAFEREAQTEALGFVRALKEVIRQTTKPVLTVGRWVESKEWEEGIMMIPEPEDAASMMAKMAGYGRYLNGAEKDRQKRA
jgi:acyl-CoA synthetase (NDP forming)